MTARFWNKVTCDKAVEVLRSASSYEEALKKISNKLKRTITKDAITNAFRVNGYDSPGSYVGEDLVGADETSGKFSRLVSTERGISLEDEEDIEDDSEDLLEEEDEEDLEEESDEDIALLMKSIKKKNHTLRTLCDEVFHLSPKLVEKIVKKAIKKGYQINLHEGEIGFKIPAPNKSAVTIPINHDGEDFIVGVFSDVHVGSDYHMKEAWVDHINHCYHELGIRDFLCPGDLLEGCYHHARFELSHVGWERQAKEAILSMPELPGLRYHFIDGNHDYTFTDQIGSESGKNLVRMANQMGRNDIFFYGSRGAMLNYGGTRIELWHPKKGSGYALSYALQNHIRDTEPQDRGDFLLSGHWHQYVQFQQGGVYAVSCGTFQHHKGPYGRSLGGTTAIGGVVLRWRRSPDGKITEFSAQHRPYNYSEPDFKII